MKRDKNADKESLKGDSENKVLKKESKEVRAIGKFTLETPLTKSFSSTANSKKDSTEKKITSSSYIQSKVTDEIGSLSGKQKSANEGYERKRDDVFKALAEPKLPNLSKENQARLQIQSPTRLYFYWSIKNDPFKTLSQAFGNKRNYTLVAKLLNQTRNIERVFPVEEDGNCWFNVEAESNYLVEIGFYAPTLPFIRIMFSNEVQTPRKGPSKRKDLLPRFDISANQFARVLDVSGYKRDAFEVLIVGDNPDSTETATKGTYFELTGKEPGRLLSYDKGDELRIALLALASGHSLEDVKPKISSGIFAELESEKDKLNANRVLEALRNNFNILTEEFFEEEIESAILGASLVNFPKRTKKRSAPISLLPKL